MIGIKGSPFSRRFEWVKWRRTRAELQQLEADTILNDRQAREIGIVLQLAKAVHFRQVREERTLKKRHIVTQLATPQGGSPANECDGIAFGGIGMHG